MTEGVTKETPESQGTTRRAGVRRPRRFLVAAIVLLWLTVTGLLVQREFGGGSAVGSTVLDDQRWSSEPSESWLSLFSAGSPPPAPTIGDTVLATRSAERRVGHAHVAQAPERIDGLDGVRLHLEVSLTLRLLGREAGLELTGTAWRARSQRRALIDFSVRSGKADFRLVGTILDDQLEADISSAGETSHFSTRIADNALFSTGFGSALSFPTLEPGENVVVPSFDPMTLRPSRSRIHAISRSVLEITGNDGERLEVPALRLRITSAGLTTTAWVDQAGQVIEAETPLGLTLRRTSKAEALRPIGDGDNASEFLRLTAIHPTGLRPRRGILEMVIRMPGVIGLASLRESAEGMTLEHGSQRGIWTEPERTDLAIPEDWRQRSLGNDRFQIGEDTADRDSAQRPTGEALARSLAADAFIQSDHPRIREQAEKILREVLPALAPGASESEISAHRARALYQWVFARIVKEPVLSLPSALEVLASRRGDCNEHTILYTALARSVGLPTRVAIGLVWSETFDGFYYHAWPEVWLGDRWHAYDPTLGQETADATHIKLLEGGIDRWPQLLPFLGRLEIEVSSTGPVRVDQDQP